MTRTNYYQKPKRLQKLSSREQLDLVFDLVNAFSIPKNPRESALLLQDLLTANEVSNLSKRLRIAKLLLDGETHREICKQIHCSLTTVVKVSEWLKQGGDGFKKVINSLPERHKYPRTLPKGPIEYHLPQTLLAIASYAAANKQEHELAKLSKKIENKRKLDLSLREQSDEYYKDRQSRKRKRKVSTL